MSVLKVKEPVTIAAVIEAVQAGDVIIDDLCVYVEDDVGTITPELVCYLDAYPEMAGDVEIYSDFVAANELELIYYGQQFNDVLRNVLEQEASANIVKVVAALNYYLENDDFMEVN